MASTHGAALTPSERFWAKVEPPDSESGCIEWTGEKRKGYGRFSLSRRHVAAHRWAYEERFGPIPAGLTIDHLCRNRSCVNPNHLEPVTNRENLMRGLGFSAQNARKTHCPQGHPYSPDNTVWASRNGRRCRTCKKAIEAKQYLRRKALRDLRPKEEGL